MLFSLLGSALLGLSTLNPIVNANTLEQAMYIEDKQICFSAAKIEGMDSPINEIYKLKDLSGNVFYAQIGENNGFMVYDPVVDNFIEKSTELVSPYYFEEQGHDYYYFGPMNYYERVDDLFFSLIDETVFDLQYATSLQVIFDEQLLAFRDAQSSDAYQIFCTQAENTISPNSISVSNKTYIDNYQYIRDVNHPSNFDGSCGYVAGSLLLYYWDRTMHKGTVREQFLNENGELNDTGSVKDSEHNLKDKLVELAGGEASSWGLPVRDALINYCNEYGIGASSYYYFGKIGLDAELAPGRPAIIFGALPNESGGDDWLVNHAVVAYGIQHEWWGGYYIVNYGYGHDKAEISLGFGFVGSVCLFELQGYESTYTIQPSDYGFPDDYCSTPTNKTVTSSSGLTFETTRLRTGFIQNEYITMCPRKKGYGTAYIDYYFINPVTSIDVNLSYWSNDERYYVANNPEARIEYYKLCENEPIETLNLLTADLPTDRTNQKTYHIDFPGGTRHIRFYTHFNNMTGYTDRNKGRISIGNMTVSTYW